MSSVDHLTHEIAVHVIHDEIGQWIMEVEHLLALINMTIYTCSARPANYICTDQYKNLI